MRILLEQALNRLNTNPAVRVIQADIQAGADASLLEKTEQRLGFSLPQELISFYSEMNGCAICWETNEGNIQTHYLNIEPIEIMFGGMRGFHNATWDDDIFEDVIWNTSNEDTFIEKAQKQKLLQSIVGASEWLTLTYDHTQQHVECYYIDRNLIHKIPLSFLSLINNLCQCCGHADYMREISKGGAYSPSESMLASIRRFFPAFVLYE